MALDAGIPVETFWDSSMDEIRELLKSRSREETRKRKEKIMDDFVMAEVIAWNIGAMLPHDEKFTLPKPWDYYPKIFAEESAAFEEQEKERQLEEYKEKRRAYVAEVNRRRQQGLM